MVAVLLLPPSLLLECPFTYLFSLFTPWQLLEKLGGGAEGGAEGGEEGGEEEGDGGGGGGGDGADGAAEAPSPADVLRGCGMVDAAERALAVAVAARYGGFQTAPHVFCYYCNIP